MFTLAVCASVLLCGAEPEPKKGEVDKDYSLKELIKLSHAQDAKIEIKGPQDDKVDYDVAVVECYLKVENISKQAIKYLPIAFDAAVCSRTGEELSFELWKWKKDFHGITMAQPLEPGKSLNYKYPFVINVGKRTKDQQFMIVFSYKLNPDEEGVYLVKTVMIPAKK